MSLTKRLLDDLEPRPDPLEDVYYGEEWPTDEQMRAEQQEDDNDG